MIDFGGGPGITQSADHWTVQGLELTNAEVTAYVCESCSGIVFRGLRAHGNVQSGLMLSGDGTTGNQVLDSDFYDNHDPSRPEQAGVGLNIRFGSGAGNVVRGNRAFDNGDNGFDLGGFRSPVTLERNWAWGNGLDHWDMPGWRSAASGFALGGGDPAPSAAHVVSLNLSWDNAAHGFSDDENPAELRLSRNTAWRNADAGFSMRVAAADLRRNVAGDNGVPMFLTADARSAGNSWDEGVPAPRFRSTDPAVAEGPRGADGRLPSTGFLTRAP